MKTQTITTWRYSEVAEQALATLKEVGYYPTIAGHGPMLTAPRYEKGFLLDPVTDVHPYAKRGVEALTRTHAPIVGYLLAHELEWIVTEETKKSDFIVKSGTGLAVGAGIFLGLLAGLAYALSSIDPAFIVVLSDPEQTWIEIVNWHD